MLIFNRFTVSVAVLGVAAVFFDTSTAPLDHVIGGAAATLGGVLSGVIMWASALLLFAGSVLVIKKIGAKAK